MATYFVDYSGGNDANDGLSFANRKKTMSGIASLSAGDVVRHMKTPDPVSLGINATWTQYSATVTLASSLTQNISTCDSAWTASANVTATVNSAAGNYKEGTGSAQLAIAAGFTTGKVAYFDLGSTQDLSAYSKVSLWVLGLGASSNFFQIKLCSDAIGDVAVNTFTFPSGLGTSGFHAVTFDNGGALSTTVRSVALYATSDPGALTVRLDNILACNTLTLNTCFGKNAAGDTFYPLQSINGTTVILGGVVTLTSGSANLRGYHGASATTTAYVRDGFMITTNGSSTTSNFGVINGSGTAASPIVISGGWDTTNMTSQTGETWYLQSANSNVGMQATSRSHFTLSKISCVQFHTGFWFTGCFNFTLSDVHSSGCFANGITVDGDSGKYTINNAYLVVNNGSNATLCANGSGDTILASGSINTNVFFTGGNGYFKNLTSSNCSAVGVDFSNFSGNLLESFTSANSVTAGVRSSSGSNYIKSGTISDSTPVAFSLTSSNASVSCLNYGGSSTDHRIFREGGTIFSESGADRDDASGFAWKLSPTSALRGVTFPLVLGGRFTPYGVRVYCKANLLVTITARAKRDNANLEVRLLVPGGQISGVSNDVSASVVGTGSYETLSLSFTPTEAGWVDVELQAYSTDGGTTYNGFFDRVTALQA